MEGLKTEELELIASNFDMIKDCYTQEEQDDLLKNFQESLKTAFSSEKSSDSLPNSKLHM